GTDIFSTYLLDYEYEYRKDSWAYYSFQLLEKNGQFKVTSFRFLPTYESLSNIHNFTFKGKSFIHYLWIILMIFIPLFIIITIVFICLTPIKLKWFWIILALTGICSLQLNWTTGQIGIKIINISILGSSFFKSGIIAPWIISFALPIGAIIFWFMRKILIKKYYEQLEQQEKERLEEQISGVGNSNSKSDILIQKEETHQETLEELLIRLKSREDALSIDFDILETCSPPKIFKFDKFLTNIKPGDKICYHDKNIKLVDSDRWKGLEESKNSEMFKIIYAYIAK
ncbi:MAG: hypothetical protein HGB12_09975, partial [Bacteroidetes bacterium]|nr:hypothetical protein [Bacteroidota bacterium]